MGKVNYCIVPCAGYGTRMLPFTKVVPKELYPIGNKPIIHIALEEIIDAKISRVSLVINKNKELLKDYFDNKGIFPFKTPIKDSQKKEIPNDFFELEEVRNINYIYQHQMLGLGDAIYKAKQHVNGSSFAVILPDDICFHESDSVLSQMTEIAKTYPDKCILAVEEINGKHIENYGVIDWNEIEGEKNVYAVKNMVEKPNFESAPSNLAIVGRYILTPDIFDAIEKVEPDINNEIQITNALKILCNEDKVIALKFQGRRFDCGNLVGAIKTVNYFHSIGRI